MALTRLGLLHERVEIPFAEFVFFCFIFYLSKRKQNRKKENLNISDMHIYKSRKLRRVDPIIWIWNYQNMHDLHPCFANLHFWGKQGKERNQKENLYLRGLDRFHPPHATGTHFSSEQWNKTYPSTNHVTRISSSTTRKKPESWNCKPQRGNTLYSKLYSARESSTNQKGTIHRILHHASTGIPPPFLTLFIINAQKTQTRISIYVSIRLRMPRASRLSGDGRIFRNCLNSNLIFCMSPAESSIQAVSC